MIGEIIAIGDELTSGRIVNTTSGFAARQLFAAGHETFAMHTIGDTPALIGEALKRAIDRVDFVIVTGGLGSTTDDMTNEAVAEALDRPPTLHKEILDIIKNHCSNSSGSVGNLEKLAWLPKGAKVLNAQSKMAGYMLIHDFTPIFFLPGVPPQMKELLVDQVLPRLTSWITSNRNHVRHCVYRVFGLQENEINIRLQDIENLADVKIGYYPVDCEVHVSLTVTNNNGSTSDTLFQNADKIILQSLGNNIYGKDQETLASVTGNLLMEKKIQLSIAESCTGGLISSLVTKVPGSSKWFQGSVIAYSNNLKENILQVKNNLIIKHGAVSGQVARAMARGIAKNTKTHVGLSVTGIAGPDGGTKEKPVGTVYIGLYYQDTTSDYLFNFSGDRKQIQELTAQTALNLIRQTLLQQIQ